MVNIIEAETQTSGLKVAAHEEWQLWVVHGGHWTQMGVSHSRFAAKCDAAAYAGVVIVHVKIPEMTFEAKEKWDE